MNQFELLNELINNRNAHPYQNPELLKGVSNSMSNAIDALEQLADKDREIEGLKHENLILTHNRKVDMGNLKVLIDQITALQKENEELKDKVTLSGIMQAQTLKDLSTATALLDRMAEALKEIGIPKWPVTDQWLKRTNDLITEIYTFKQKKA